MYLALHAILLHAFVFRLCSAGEPGYLDFDNLPETNFSCQGKVIGGYYADVEAGCQMFHVCTIGLKDDVMDIKFLCLNGTVFDQETRVCERVDEVDCSKSERFYNLNLELYGNHAVTLSLDDDMLDTAEIEEKYEQHFEPSPKSTAASTTESSHQAYKKEPAPALQPDSLYNDDRNDGYHHQYIYHNSNKDEEQATSYQLFSNKAPSSTTSSHFNQNTVLSQKNLGHGVSAIKPLQRLVESVEPTQRNVSNEKRSEERNRSQYDIDNFPADFNDFGSNKTNRHSHDGYPVKMSTSSNNEKVTAKTMTKPVKDKNFKLTESPVNYSFFDYPAEESSTPALYFFRKSNNQPYDELMMPHSKQLSSLIPSQSRIIITAKASVSDESGKALNASHVVVLPQSRIPTSYDDYKEGDESLDPFYQDVPKVGTNVRKKRETKNTSCPECSATPATADMLRKLSTDTVPTSDDKNNKPQLNLPRKKLNAIKGWIDKFYGTQTAYKRVHSLVLYGQLKSKKPTGYNARIKRPFYDSSESISRKAISSNSKSRNEAANNNIRCKNFQYDTEAIKKSINILVIFSSIPNLTIIYSRYKNRFNDFYNTFVETTGPHKSTAGGIAMYTDELSPVAEVSASDATKNEKVHQSVYRDNDYVDDNYEPITFTEKI